MDQQNREDTHKSNYLLLKNNIYNQYLLACSLKPTQRPPYLSSFYVYLAYNSAWKFIDRKRLTNNQITLMKSLGCYKPSRTEMGIRRFPPTHFSELPVG